MVATTPQNIDNFEVSGDATLTLAGPAAAISPAQIVGNYDVTDVSFSASLTSALLDQVNPILTGGPEPNTVTATITVTTTSTPDLPVGSEITLTLGNASAVIGP